MPENITPLQLITALGNVSLVLQLVDFFNGGERYRYNQEAAAVRRIFAGRPLAALYLICTEETIGALENELRPKLVAEYPQVELFPILLPCRDIACEQDDETMRQLVYEQVRHLAAHDLVISSGGRKTLTNRLVEAGLLYGCMGYLTLTAPRTLEQTPDRSQSESFNVLWISARNFSEERRNHLIRKGELGDNFRSLYLLPTTIVGQLEDDRVGVDPARRSEELAWLHRLPKADLHCHLGGAFDAGLLKTMATALLADLKVEDQVYQRISRAMVATLGSEPVAWNAAAFRPFIEGEFHCLWGLSKLLAILPQADRLVAPAVLVDLLSLDQLTDLIDDGYPRESEWPCDLAWYMARGDLGGSTLLQSENTLRLALAWLMEQAARENVRFMEVRFSPGNYTRGGLSIPQIIEILLDEAAVGNKRHPHLRVNFLLMATRHKEHAAMEAHVAAAVTFGRPGGGQGPRITGFDLAGQEEGYDPGRFQEVFLPLHHHFMNITIHAGEMAEDDKIWQAIYQLHARRIGHGLKLVNNPRMMNYIRDYGIAIEMCPSSNRQTNGYLYQDNRVVAKSAASRAAADDCDMESPDGVDLNAETIDSDACMPDIYPLGCYLQKGLAVTINTDNRGISATTMSNEYLEAARLTPGGLSRWEILRLIKNGFKAAFLPKDEKDDLLRKIDLEVFRLVLNDFFPETP